MKKFYFDRLLDKENICNLNKEKKALWQGIQNKKKLVVYGTRNCGKTSLVKNVIIPKFKNKHKKSFVFFCDLMEVKNLDQINQRIQRSFEQAFIKSFPKTNLIKQAAAILKNFRPQVNIDANTGHPSLALTYQSDPKILPLQAIFETINNKISRSMNCIIVLDEFQDIAFVDQAQALFRQEIQETKNIPIIFMGSKKHILSNIFARPNAPLAQTGEDIEFKPIPYNEYHDYMSERFLKRQIKIDLKTSQELQDLLWRNPEAINIICAHILDSSQKCTITSQNIQQAMQNVSENRRTRYEHFLSYFSDKEESVLVALANFGFVTQPNGKDFIRAVPVSGRAIRKIFKKLMNKSVIEKTQQGYRLSDPLLAYFLKVFR
jgi:AAA+ ATPase superfamily predicted ATPase